MPHSRPNRPPVRVVYYTDDLGRMASARAIGGILWSHEHGDQRGVLLWESLQDASEWQIARAGRPTVVVEIDRQDLDMPELRRAAAVITTPGQRAWIYPHAISFSAVRWHTFREELAEPARTYTIHIPGLADPPPTPSDLQGEIRLPI